jgi:hypothetical protein
VNWFSVSADAALEDKPTAATIAESLENEKITLKPKDGTAEPISHVFYLDMKRVF